MTRVYIAGPITGHDDLNEPAFRQAAETWARSGHDVVVPLDVKPADHDGECPPSYGTAVRHTNACYLRSGLVAMLTCEVIVLLPGWESSVGTRLELSVAAAVGMRVVVAAEAGG